jgi:hypothetical protein
MTNHPHTDSHAPRPIQAYADTDGRPPAGALCCRCGTARRVVITRRGVIGLDPRDNTALRSCAACGERTTHAICTL